MKQDGQAWDLSPLYASPEDPALEEDLKEALQLAGCFRHDFRGRIASDNLSAELLAAALRASEQLQTLLLKPCLYAQLLFAANSGPAAHKALVARTREVWSEVSEQTLFFELEILRIDQELYQQLIRDPEVAPYRHHLDRLRAQAPYTLSEQVEQALKRKDLSGREAFVQLFDELTAGLRFRFLMPEEEAEREVTGEELLSLLYHPERQVRERAFATFLQRHAEQELVLTACFNNILLDHGKEAELRGYPDLMTPTHLECETSPEMVERMMAVTEANYGLARDYFELKRQLLGYDELKNTDIYAPVGTTSRRFALDEARQLVHEAFAGFSPRMAELADAFFFERRIDVPPRPGKTGGAFCIGMYPGCPPYVLLNFTGTLRDVSTLAHELGHGVHFALAQKQNLFHYQAPLPFAETASVFGEMLLTRHLLARESDPQVKISLLCAKLEEIIATTFRQNVLTRFEQKAHAARSEGLLSADDLCRLWWEENARLFGDRVSMIEPYRWGWSYISHFIHARFYCYSYVFGELLTLALYQRYLEDGRDFVPRFLTLLENGGSDRPENLLRPLGIDLADAGFWQQGYDLVAELLGQLRELMAGRNRQV
ncbi:oligoendopeptidase F [Geothermobacter ehrlichii]|uniref:Oligoendopeptidase F n=1 Tax=Geothermobacter ehrlichii TaxID=213224 RepID=A0A5D3WLA3_9BACT|nr:M3 family oligoendopeptidase [Geothermobacter ehrlichii]TYO99217.1 oligoendopeptidase F [Geothermobacter ehrlichii]